MLFVRNRARAHQQKLERFRKSFLMLIADGRYPPERQQRLFRACKHIGLDWDEARRYVRDDAMAFLVHVARNMHLSYQRTPLECAELQLWQRRLGLADTHLQQVLDMVLPAPPAPPAPAPPAPVAPTVVAISFSASVTSSGLAGQLKTGVMHLPPSGFEEWTRDILVYLGWEKVQLVGGSRDRGIDIRGVYHGERCIVQCKHYRGRLVPPGEVRALVGTRHIHKVKRAYLITSGRFGHSCFVEVHKKPVELWDIDTLAAHLTNKQHKGNTHL